MKLTNCNNKTNIDILPSIATMTVVVVGIASYTSGLQKWNGLADNLNKNPVDIIKKDKCI